MNASMPLRVSSRSYQPHNSPSERTPILAMRCRTSSASERKYAMIISGLPLNRIRSVSSCVAMPTGHVLR